MSTCTGCLHLPLKRVPHRLRICRWCTRNDSVLPNVKDHFYSKKDYGRKIHSYYMKKG